MPRVSVLLAAAIACGCCYSVAGAVTALETIKVGSWRGGAFTSDKTGTFSHCTATNQVGAGQELFLTQPANGPVILGLADPNLHLRKGKRLLVDVTFDQQAPVPLAGAAISAHMVMLVLEGASAAAQLGKAHQIAAVIGGQTYQFAIDSVAQVLPALSDCVAKAKAGGVANAALAPDAKPADGGPASGGSTGGAKPAERTFGVSGTGFIVSANGYVVTNDHVIRGCVGAITGNLTNGEVMTLRVASTDQINDLALLQAPGTFPDHAVIRATAIRSGEPVIVIGFPFHGLLTSDFTVTTGIVSSLSGILNDTRYLQTSAPLQPGNSGGPMFDSAGAVAGVAAAKLNALRFAGVTGGTIPENVNFAIKTGALRDFLDNSAVPYKTAAPTAAALKTEEVAARARAHTMLISCKAKATAKE